MVLIVQCRFCQNKWDQMEHTKQNMKNIILFIEIHYGDGNVGVIIFFFFIEMRNHSMSLVNASVARLKFIRLQIYSRISHIEQEPVAGKYPIEHTHTHTPKLLRFVIFIYIWNSRSNFQRCSPLDDSRTTNHTDGINCFCLVPSLVNVRIFDSNHRSVGSIEHRCHGCIITDNNIHSTNMGMRKRFIYFQRCLPFDGSGSTVCHGWTLYVLYAKLKWNRTSLLISHVRLTAYRDQLGSHYYLIFIDISDFDMDHIRDTKCRACSSFIFTSDVPNLDSSTT